MFIGVCDVVADLCVERLLRTLSDFAESVSFEDKSFGDISEVGSHVRDVTLGDVVYSGVNVLR